MAQTDKYVLGGSIVLGLGILIAGTSSLMRGRTAPRDRSPLPFPIAPDAPAVASLPIGGILKKP